MIPVFIASLLVLLLAQASSASRGKSAGGSSAGVSAGAVIALAVWLSLGPLFLAELSATYRALARGQWREAVEALPVLALCALTLFPWPITRLVLIPMGWPRLAWALTRLSFWIWRGDVRNGAAVAAAWAAARKPEPSPDLLAWIERRRDALPRPGTVRWRMGGSGIVATGMLAAARNDRVTARRMLLSVDALDDAASPKRALVLTWEWLCAEAVERGAWREVASLAASAPVRSRSTRLLATIADRLLGNAPTPSDAQLYWRWLLAPHRLATHPLLTLALTKPSTTGPSERSAGASQLPDPPLPPQRDSLAFALGLHAFTLGRAPEQLDAAALDRLGAAWDRAFADPALARRLVTRGLALRVQDTGPTLAALRQSVRGDLLALVRRAKLGPGSLDAQGETSELLSQAVRELHAQVLDGLEIAVGALDSRVSSHRELPPIDEWLGFLAIREQYAEAASLGGSSLRRLAFQEVHSPLCDLAVWLWNERSERALGNAIFQWLLTEAIAVDDAEAIRLQERNVGCGL
ncbi:hypothetical protein G6O69_21690 [Pseudenhygromyxa sp. WMMC2535]|uniref:hypothetical protein n=1 Tax=Pseudenhygromyxa sp. WMMC2535 TaxID=2712867 RepID=UPI0015580CF8|nr:hypothetical protein [Pseudenhygromyxa sp. WMMC2535]NVB40468.1 hypothetical protein [Pseudenhygromyxa sp. WMMC2535]